MDHDDVDEWSIWGPEQQAGGDFADSDDALQSSEIGERMPLVGAVFSEEQPSEWRRAKEAAGLGRLVSKPKKTAAASECWDEPPPGLDGAGYIESAHFNGALQGYCFTTREGRLGYHKDTGVKTVLNLNELLVDNSIFNEPQNDLEC